MTSPPSSQVAGPAGDAHRHGLMFLLDGNNLAYRAFYALPESISTSTGFPTNALYGFCSMIIKILAEQKPEVVIVAWDSREKTFRHDEFEDYKAQRRPMPDLLSEQWPYFEELASAFGFINLKLSGYEADDLLATLARQADSEARDVMIVTGDRDALQLVTPHVRVMANTRGVTEVRIYDPDAVVERYGVGPDLIPDLIGLKGDTSDNIPGIPGIGEKTAAQLLQQFGSLETLLDHVDEVKGAKKQQLLREHRDVAVMSKGLAVLRPEAPIEIHAAEVAPHRLDYPKLRELFLRFEFATLLDRLHEVLPEEQVERESVVETPMVAGPVVMRTAGPGELEHALAWDRQVGVAVRPAASRGPAATKGVPVSLPELEEPSPPLWLAQEAAEPGGEAVILAVPDVTAAREVLPSLLAGGLPVCHDFKRSVPLHDLVDHLYHDTYLAAYLLAPGRRSYDLEEVCRELGVPPVWLGAQGLQPEGDGPLEEGPEPAGVEALACLRAAAAQEQLLRSQGMWDLFQDVELPLTRVLLEMEKVGVHLDTYRLGEITARISDQMSELEESIYELAGGPFNLGSPAQLGQVLFERLGLPRQRKTKTGHSTDAKTLEALRNSHPIIELLEAHRELSKLLSTYLLALPAAINPSTERLHTTFHQTITATGRLSSSDPNLQNIPIRTALGSQIRQCFTAPAGRSLIAADYSQIELRIMAHLAEEPTLLEAFHKGEDIHAHTAAEVFGLEESEVTATHRRYAKAVNFGIMYGLSPFGLSQQLGIEREEAAAYIARYFERMPRVRSFIDATILEAREQGFVSTLFGRRRPIPELRSRNYQTRSLGERLAVNSIIQGTAADIIKVAMIRCYHRLRRDFPGTELFLQVHDELLFEAPEGQAEAASGAVIEEMVAAFDMDPPLVVDAGIGADWLSAK